MIVSKRSPAAATAGLSPGGGASSGEPSPLGAGQEFWLAFRENKGAFLGLTVVVLLGAIALLAPWISPYDPAAVHEGAFRLPPAWAEGGNARFWLGTDDVGRDVLSRLIHGARVSMGVGFMVVAFSLSIGCALGLVAGYVGGWVDSAVMRAMDVLMALPSILLAIVVVTALGQSLANAIVAVGVTALPGFVRLVRGSVMAEKTKQYVAASRSVGAGHLRQMVANIFPNCLAPVIVQGTLGFSDGILNVAALGFLGMGAKPPTAEWGTMLADARAFIESQPWLVTLPGLCILAAVLGFNLLGDGLRDALDPRLRR